jgi:hypothetical protein
MQFDHKSIFETHHVQQLLFFQILYDKPLTLLHKWNKQYLIYDHGCQKIWRPILIYDHGCQKIWRPILIYNHISQKM